MSNHFELITHTNQIRDLIFCSDYWQYWLRMLLFRLLHVTRVLTLKVILDHVHDTCISLIGMTHWIITTNPPKNCPKSAELNVYVSSNDVKYVPLYWNIDTFIQHCDTILSSGCANTLGCVDKQTWGSVPWVIKSMANVCHNAMCITIFHH